MCLSLKDMKKAIIILLLLVSQVQFAQNDYLLAERYYRDGAYEKAVPIYKALFEKNRYNTTYLKRLINSYQELSEYTTVKKLLEKQLKTNPTHSYLLVELGYNFERQQQKDSATLYYDKAINSIQKNPGMGGYIGRLFKENALLDYAITAYEKSMQLNPNVNYEFQLAQIYGEQGNFEKMFISYIDLVDKNANYLNTVQRYTSQYITDDKLNENNISFKKALIKKSVSNPKDVWNKLLSWLFVQQKEYNKAFIQEKALFKRNPNHIRNIIRLGYGAFDGKEYKTATNCFQFIIDNSPFIDQKINADLYLLKIAIATNQPNIDALFKNVYATYGKKSNTLKIQLEESNYLTFVKNEPQKSVAILEHALQISRSKFEKAEIKIALGDVHVFIGNYNKALIYFSQVQTSIKNHPLAQKARFKVAQTSYFKNDFKWAFAQLKVLKASTTQLIANDALDLFLIISDNQAKDSLETGLTLYAKADLLAFQNKNQESIEVLQQIITKFKGQKIEDESLYKQANLYVKTGQYESAIKNLHQIISLDKESIFVDDAIYLIAEIYKDKLNLPQKASEYYQKIIFEHPSSIYLVAARKKYRTLRGDNIN